MFRIIVDKYNLFRNRLGVKNELIDDNRHHNNSNDVNAKQFVYKNHLYSILTSNSIYLLIPKISAISDQNNNNNISKKEIYVPFKEEKEKTNDKSTVKISFFDKFFNKTRKTDENSEVKIDYKRMVVRKEGDTGYDRIKFIWRDFRIGEDNAEIQFITNSFTAGFVFGILYGGIVKQRTNVENFIRRHNDFVYRGKIGPKRFISDNVLFEFGKSGLKYAWRISLLCGSLTTLTTAAIIYRNDVYYRDMMCSGAIVCSLAKARLGLRAVFVTALLGSMFGAIYAASIKLALLVTGTTIPEYRHWRHAKHNQESTVRHYTDGTSEYDWKLEAQTLNNSSDSNNDPTSTPLDKV